jgi:dihydroorotate dehydrogenase electron transfer subunit
MKQLTAPVISNRELMPQVHLLWLEAPEIAVVARPGQFLMVRCGDSDDPLLRRPLSIHQVTEAGQIALLFDVVGRGTLLLSRHQQGDSLDLLGPLGNGFSIRPGSHRLLLVAGGVGVAPLLFLAVRALDQGCLVTLLMGAQNASLLYPLSSLPSEIACFTTTEDGSAGVRGLATGLIAKCADQADQVFACGPTAMYRSMVCDDVLTAKPIQISLEIMMGCGVGACYGCTVGTRRGLQRVCRDGPVFELGDVIW